MTPESIILIGIPASGKSTFFRKQFFDSHVRINLDMLRTRNREKILFEACLKAKQSFVIDNTNVQKVDRERYINAAKEHGFTVIGYFLRSSLQECLARNKKREPKKVIPEAGVKGRFAKLEMPSVDEGFDELYYVRIGGEGDFVVVGKMKFAGLDKKMRVFETSQDLLIIPDIYINAPCRNLTREGETPY